MIRIIFENGAIENCEHICKMYVEQYEMDKIIIVGRLEDESDVSEVNRRAEKSDKDN